MSHIQFEPGPTRSCDGLRETNGPVITFTTHTHTHTLCPSQWVRGFMRPLRSLTHWPSAAPHCINQPIISCVQQRRRANAAPPPNPITFGEWARGSSDWTTWRRVAAPMTRCFDLVMMLIFSIWLCASECVPERRGDPQAELHPNVNGQWGGR